MVTASSQSSGEARSPAVVAEQIFGESPYHTMRRLRCCYRDGVLAMYGRVPSYYLKALAHIAIRNLDGVRQIRNDIEVSADDL